MIDKETLDEIFRLLQQIKAFENTTEELKNKVSKIILECKQEYVDGVK